MRQTRWTTGCCSTFAVALQKRFGGELWAIVNHSRKYPEQDELWHCYCVINGLAYDAEGGYSLDEVSDTSSEYWPIPEMDKNNDVVIRWQKVDVEWFEVNHENYDPNDLPAANKFIARHLDRFSRS